MPPRRMTIAQTGRGTFEVPAWDPVTHDRAREALVTLGSLGGTKDNRFGKPGEVDPISWLLGTAAGWGGNPPADAIYPIYDAKGFMFVNPQKASAVNNVTAKKNADGSYQIRFGGDPAGADNYLAIAPGWNYVLRLYRPRKEIIDGTWKAPELRPLR